MTHTDIAGLIARFPLLEPLIALTPVTWFNPGATSLAEGLPHVGLTRHDVASASARLARFAPYLCEAFPETVSALESASVFPKISSSHLKSITSSLDFHYDHSRTC